MLSLFLEQRWLLITRAKPTMLPKTLWVYIVDKTYKVS